MSKEKILGYFEEQLNNRRSIDDKEFMKSMVDVANVIMGKGISKYYDARVSAKSAIEEVLKYFYIKSNVENIPNHIKSVEEIIEYITKPLSVMSRDVVLEDDWYNKTFEPMIGRLKNTKTLVAIIPRKTKGYVYIDYTNGVKKNIDKETVKNLEKEAICFYKPLPLKALKPADIIKFLMESFNVKDITEYFLTAILVSVVSLLTPVFTKVMVGDVIALKEPKIFVSISIFMICHIVAILCFNIFKEIMRCKIMVKYDAIIESALFGRIFSLTSEFFRKYTSGELAEKLLISKEMINTLMMVVWSSVISVILSFLYFFNIYHYAKEMLLITSVVIIVEIIIIAIAIITSFDMNVKMLDIRSRVQGNTLDIITGMQKIKVAGAEKRMFAKWANEYKDIAKIKYNPPVFFKIILPLHNVVILGASTIIYWKALKCGMSISNYYAFNSAIVMIMTTIKQIMMEMQNIMVIGPSLRTLQPIFEAVPELSEDKIVVDKLDGNIEFSNVSFRYNKEMPLVLDNISFNIKNGEYVGIVGPTGCGKSTIIRLLLGFEKPTKGSIYYDKKDLKILVLKSVRKQIGTVMQNDGLFSGDIFSNISINNPHMTMDEAWEISKQVIMYDDIKRMPMQMKTMISDGGGDVSGGQKQRLLIARALASKPKILIFDEATSALDNVTQKKVSESLEKLKCTRIAVAHRLSTIRHCDRIIVIDGGHIVEEGTYEELINNGGLFKTLVERQTIEI